MDFKKILILFFLSVLFTISCVSKRPTSKISTVAIPSNKKSSINSQTQKQVLPTQPDQQKNALVHDSAPTSQNPSQVAEDFEKVQNWGAAFTEWSRLANNKSLSETLVKQYNEHALNVAVSHFSQEEMISLASNANAYLQAHLYFKIAESYSRSNDSSSALRFYEKSYQADSTSDIGKLSKANFDDIYTLRSVAPQTIGVVLPLTGRSSNVAQRTLRGIELGLGMHLPGSSFKLAVIDSEGNPESARRGVERLAREDNPIAIIGGILSKTATAISTKSNELGIPNIALSQKANITSVGSFVFRNSLTAEAQIQELTRIAVNELKLKKFAILFPNDAYGVDCANLFWDYINARGGQITAIQPYDPKETDFREPIQRMVGTFYLEPRLEEYKYLMTELKNEAGKKLGRKAETITQNLLPPIVDFDAIFIPDGVKSVGQIAAMLLYNNVKNVKILGTNLLNNPELPKRLGAYASNTIFIDGYLSQADSRFAKVYESVFKDEPTLVEAQAYDSAYLLRSLIASGATTRLELAEKINKTQNFASSIGFLSVSEDREFIRPTFALTVDKNQITLLK